MDKVSKIDTCLPLTDKVSKIMDRSLLSQKVMNLTYSAKNVGHLTLFYFNIIQRLCHIRKQPIATWNKIVYIHDEQKNQ